MHLFPKRSIMKEPLRVLIVDDSQLDAELAIHALRQAGYDPVWHIVETEADYLSALAGPLDLILCDHRLPQFDSARALDLRAERGLDIPFILLSGTIDTQDGVAAVFLGAAEYVFKDRME